MNAEDRAARIVSDIDKLLAFEGEAFDAARGNVLRLARATASTVYQELRAARQAIAAVEHELSD